jgi:hypothetical protein
MISKLYLQIAREAIQARLNGSIMNTDVLLQLHPDLRIKRATFVTLTHNGQLRGCIGSLIAYHPLIRPVAI